MLSVCLWFQNFAWLSINATSFTAICNVQVRWPPNSAVLVSGICDDSKTADACCSSSSFHLADPEVDEKGSPTSFEIISGMRDEKVSVGY
jgi:hypothetical protein